MNAGSEDRCIRAFGERLFELLVLKQALPGLKEGLLSGGLTGEELDVAEMVVFCLFPLSLMTMRFGEAAHTLRDALHTAAAKHLAGASPERAGKLKKFVVERLADYIEVTFELGCPPEDRLLVSRSDHYANSPWKMMVLFILKLDLNQEKLLLVKPPLQNSYQKRGKFQ